MSAESDEFEQQLRMVLQDTETPIESEPFTTRLLQRLPRRVRHPFFHSAWAVVGLGCFVPLSAWQLFRLSHHAREIDVSHHVELLNPSILTAAASAGVWMTLMYCAYAAASELFEWE